MVKSLLLRLFGLLLVGGSAVLIAITTLMAGLASDYDAWGFLMTFILGLGLWGPLLVAGVHCLLFPLTAAPRRASRMRLLAWGLAASPVIAFLGVMAWAGEGLPDNQSGDVSLYLTLFLTSAVVGSMMIWSKAPGDMPG